MGVPGVFDTGNLTAAGLVGWTVSCPLLWVAFLARGVFTKLEHRRTVLGPLVGWGAICSGWLHVRVRFWVMGFGVRPVEGW